MKKYLLNILLWIPLAAASQSDEHYTMFLYNKLLYNPAYAGSRELLSANGAYRNQWTGFRGAPVTYNATIDAPVGKQLTPYKKTALGLSFSSETAGIESRQSIMAYYAYRIKLSRSVLSLGLRGGIKLYSANYSQLNPYQQNDPNLAGDIKNAALPNFGAGAYWLGNNFYAGLSVPALLENYYDKNEKQLNGMQAKEIRGYYLSGGYIFTVSDNVKLEPQAMIRMAKDANYKLPLSCDLNISAIVLDRIMAGITYRTDNSVEGIIHLQATRNINVGYAYDYTTSALNNYSSGTHEIVVGFDIGSVTAKYANPRFVKNF